LSLKIFPNFNAATNFSMPKIIQKKGRFVKFGNNKINKKARRISPPHSEIFRSICAIQNGLTPPAPAATRPLLGFLAIKAD